MMGPCQNYPTMSQEFFLYYSARDGTKWLNDKFSETTSRYKDDNGNVIVPIISSIFHVKKSDMVFNNDEYAVFKIGNFDGDFYNFNNEILNDIFELSVRKGSEVELNIFTAEKKISVMKLIFETIGRKIIIGEDEGEISLSTLTLCRKKYPSETELRHYVLSRISGILSEDIPIEKDHDEAFRKYVQKRRIGKQISDPDLNDIQLQSLVYIHKKLEYMLDTSERYKEREWQEEIQKIILFIYPQYIAAFRDTKLKKVHGYGKEVDFILIGANGYVDVLEIKTPKETVISARADYRNNHTPSKVVSSTAIQIENYLFALNQWGEEGGKKLTEKYKSLLPPSIEEINISNPRGIMFIGRSKGYNKEQNHA